MSHERDDAGESPTWRYRLDEVLLATVFLTRLPIRLPARALVLRLGPALWSAPLVGLPVGLVVALTYLAGRALGLPDLAAAGLGVAAGLAMTGALHEDGLADLADGFGGGAGRTRKLKILRDPRLGSYGALALGLSLLLRASALAALDGGAALAVLPAVHALSRAGLPALMVALAPARSGGLGADAGRPARRVAFAAAGVAGLAALVLLGFSMTLVLALVAGAAVAGIGLLARQQIGGYTGDVLGAGQQAAEIAGLLALAALLG